MRKILLLLIVILTLISPAIPLTNGTSPQNYSVTFSETGLPQNLSWYVLVNEVGTTADSPNITFSEPNGTYSYLVGDSHGFPVTPQQGDFVVNGTGIHISVQFAVPYYNVTFEETGLPRGFNWQIDFAGKTVQMNSSSYEFREYNGSHPFTIASGNSTYRPVPSSGVIVVSGSNVTESIVFKKVEYTVTFVEQGLATGTTWNVNVSGQNESSNGTVMDFNLTNGSYRYSVPMIQGYSLSGGLRNFTVNGANLTFNISFTPPQPYTFVVTGLGAGAIWHLEIAGSNYTSNGSFITVYLFPANYSYRVMLPYGYSASGTTGTVGGSNDVVFISATDLLMEYVVVIALVVVIDLILAFFLLRRRSRKIQKQ